MGRYSSTLMFQHTYSMGHIHTAAMDESADSIHNLQVLISPPLSVGILVVSLCTKFQCRPFAAFVITLLHVPLHARPSHQANLESELMCMLTSKTWNALQLEMSASDFLRHYAGANRHALCTGMKSRDYAHSWLQTLKWMLEANAHALRKTTGVRVYWNA